MGGQKGNGSDTKTNSRIKVISDESVAWVPNGSSPPAPDVLYVVPTFGWTRRTLAGTTRSWRDGGGLRIYLNRPWFVTGFNEMLAVDACWGAARTPSGRGHRSVLRGRAEDKAQELMDRPFDSRTYWRRSATPTVPNAFRTRRHFMARWRARLDIGVAVADGLYAVQQHRTGPSG